MTLEPNTPADAPQPGTYRHYKGPLYQVLGMAQHSETDEWMVVYQALYAEHGFWLRPLSLWLEPVVTQPSTPTGKGDNRASQDGKVQSKPRFELINPSSNSLTQLTKQKLL